MFSLPLPPYLLEQSGVTLESLLKKEIKSGYLCFKKSERAPLWIFLNVLENQILMPVVSSCKRLSESNWCVLYYKEVTPLFFPSNKWRMENSNTDDKDFIVGLFFFLIWDMIKCMLSKRNVFAGWYYWLVFETCKQQYYFMYKKI